MTVAFVLLLVLWLFAMQGWIRSMFRAERRMADLERRVDRLR